MHLIQTVVGVVLFAAVIASLLLLYHWRGVRPVLDFGITFMRYRYCLFLCFAPTILGLSAWSDPYMLSAMLYVREGLFDITVVTTMCFFTVGVGLAEMRLIQLHGDARFADRKFLLTWPRQSPELQPESMPIRPIDEKITDEKITDEKITDEKIRTGWKVWKIGAWFMLSLIFPVFCVWSVPGEQPNKPIEGISSTVTDVAEPVPGEKSKPGTGEKSNKMLIGGIAIGSALAVIVAMILAVVQRAILGGLDRTATSGILPFELVVQSKPDAYKKMHTWAEWLFGTEGKGFSWLLDGPGYTYQDPEKHVLLPGQAQNIILIAFSALLYLGNYAYGMVWDTGWTALNWPTAFFAILLLFLIGFLLSGVAYWLDRFGLPPIVFAAIYLFACFSMGASDHFFEVDVKPRRLKDHLNEKDTDKSNAYVSAGVGPRLSEKELEKELEQLFWFNVVDEWPIPEINGKKTLVVVTASGGGIQASAWTTKVLTELDNEMPGFARSIALISSVSGGSVGTMYYVGRRGPFDTLMTPDVKQAIGESSRKHSLEAVGWGLAFPDFVRSVAPPAAPPLADRGWAIESWWRNQMGRPDRDDRIAMSEVTLRDLIASIEAHEIPPFIFNATCVETGQRVQISPLHVEVANEKNSLEWPLVKEIEDRAQRSDVLEARNEQLVSKPIDFLDFYDACLVGNKRNHSDAWTRANLRVSTAARLSATFSYVTPVARPCPSQDFGILPLIQRCLARPTDLEKRLHLHFCDGGYADNPGLVTAIRMLKDLMDHYRHNDLSVPFDQVLIVRIEPFPKTVAQVAKDNTGYMSAINGPTTAMHATRVSSQAERGELELRLLQASGPDFRKEYVSAKKAVSNWKTDKSEPLKADTILQDEAKVSGFLSTAGVESNVIADVMKEGASSVKSKLAQLYSKNLANQRNVKGRSVPIISVQFRFELYEPPSSDSENKRPKLVTPPLTWTLTKAQKDAIDRAWKNLKDGRRWEEIDTHETADSISPAEMKAIFTPK